MSSVKLLFVNKKHFLIFEDNDSDIEKKKKHMYARASLVIFQR